MQRADRVEHLLHGVGRVARRQIGLHAKGEFRLGDAHFIARHRRRAAIRDHGLGQDASGHRSLDIDVLLPGLAGGGDLPAEQFFAGVVFDRRLDRIGLGAVARTQLRFQDLRAWCRRANGRAGFVTPPLSDLGRALLFSAEEVKLTQSRSWFPVRSAAATAASPISSSRRIRRSVRNSRAPDAETPRCRGRRFGARCCDRSRR